MIDIILIEDYNEYRLKIAETDALRGLHPKSHSHYPL